MILSDKSIREQIEKGRLGISPFEPELVQPSSVDMRLGRVFCAFKRGMVGILDTKKAVDELMETIEIPDDGAFNLPPREFVLGTTLESVSLPDDIVGRLEGRSSLGRLGIVIHSTAGYVDPGFCGQLTLEISNLAPVPVILYPGMRIAQISFIQMTTAADKPYTADGLGSKYQGQRGPTPSRLYRDFE
jgi:dCTP deaminase